jgi:lipoprotein-anchoring transpeptidase ErfK/SrfK
VTVRRLFAAVAIAAALLIAGIAFVENRPPDVSEVAEVSFDDAALRLRIDISERKLHVEKNGESVATYGIAVGTGNHPTPQGSFSIRRMVWNPRWVPPDSEWARDEKPRGPGDPKNPMGRVKIFFREPTYYIHGTNAEGSIGRAASHGCVRMRNADAIELARTLIDQAGAPIEPGLIQRLINHVRQTREVRLSNVIPLQIQA